MTQSLMRRRLSIGFGCSSRAESDQLIQLIQASLDPIPSDTLLATLDRREPMGRSVAEALGLELCLFSSDTLACIRGVSTASSLALAQTGTANVAEAAALASLGPEARLIVPQTKGRYSTCAVAAVFLEVQG